MAVTTNNGYGYDLNVATNDSARGSIAANAMKHTNTSVQTAILPTSGGSTLSENTWGVKVGSGNWMTVSADAENPTTLTSGSKTSSLCTSIATYASSCTEGTSYELTTVTFGANVTDSLPAGTYENTVLFTATARTNANN